MSLSSSTPIGTLFHMERAGIGPVDAAHALITSVNEPATGLQWRLRAVLFQRDGSSSVDLDILIHSKPSGRRYRAKRIALAGGDAHARWPATGDEPIYLTNDLEVAISATGLGAAEEWRFVLVGEIVAQALL